ncbi:hypothetical protein AA313_de0201452 [Arthrobotrys entomopaga]|nr:hypothetical protein AA313_de0201452 [Arthrobotrys entomopaga]
MSDTELSESWSRAQEALTERKKNLKRNFDMMSSGKSDGVKIGTSQSASKRQYKGKQPAQDPYPEENSDISDVFLSPPDGIPPLRLPSPEFDSNAITLKTPKPKGRIYNKPTPPSLRIQAKPSTQFQSHQPEIVHISCNDEDAAPLQRLRLVRYVDKGTNTTEELNKGKNASTGLNNEKKPANEPNNNHCRPFIFIHHVKQTTVTGVHHTTKYFTSLPRLKQRIITMMINASKGLKVKGRMQIVNSIDPQKSGWQREIYFTEPLGKMNTSKFSNDDWQALDVDPTTLPEEIQTGGTIRIGLFNDYVLGYPGKETKEVDQLCPDDTQDGDAEIWQSWIEMKEVEF